MPLSKYAIDTFIGKEISALTQCKLPALADKFPQSALWVSNFVLTSILKYQFSDDLRRFAFPFLRRAESAFAHYELLRSSIEQFVSADSVKPSVYFRAISNLEITVAMLYQAYNLGKDLLKKQLFTKGEGSSLEWLNVIYNESRYVNPSLQMPDQLHSIWITNDSIHCRECSLSFEELTNMLSEIGRIADQLSSAEPAK